LMKDAKLDIVLPIKFVILNIGGKISSTQNTSENIYSNVYNNYYVLDPSRSDHFKYIENVQALYVSAQKTWGKWEAKVGLRGEYTQTTAISEALQETDRNDYFKLFPTAYLQYKMNNDNSFG